MMCAANNLNLAGALTVTNGTLDTTRSLGLPRGLTLSADTDGTGPGVAGGTVIFDSLAPPWAVTNAPVTVTYNPVSYTTASDFSTKFTLTAGAALEQRMLVFPEVTKTYDGTTTATLVSLKGNPADVSLVADPGSTAVFSSAEPGTGKTVTFTGYRLTGANAARYALATSCCGPIVSKTTGTITANPAFLLTNSGSGSGGNPGALPAFLAGFLTAPEFGGNVMPTAYADTGDVFLALAEEEVAPAVIPLPPQAPYIAPRYAPRPVRN